MLDSRLDQRFQGRRLQGDFAADEARARGFRELAGVEDWLDIPRRRGRCQPRRGRRRRDLAARHAIDLVVQHQAGDVEIAPAGVTKWSAIQRLAQQWGIAEAEICAVGDDVNDIPMIRAAGLGVAMGNAQPSVKAAADRIAPTHDEDGLVQVVEWLLEGREQERTGH